MDARELDVGHLAKIRVFGRSLVCLFLLNGQRVSVMQNTDTVQILDLFSIKYPMPSASMWAKYTPGIKSSQ